MEVQGYIDDGRGGKRCPVETCGAVCCRASHYLPGRKGPCELLGPDRMCIPHKLGGIKAKPWGCAEYPRNQADIDAINRQAEAAGFTERCLLRVVEDG